MWPLDLPARDVLKLPGETPIRWAVFDWRWYLRSYPEVVGVVGDDDPSDVLEYYLERGQQLGHSPNRMFDERWHRRMYPQMGKGLRPVTGGPPSMPIAGVAHSTVPGTGCSMNGGIATGILI